MSYWVQDAESEFLGSGCKERVHGFRMQRVSSWIQDAESEFMGSGCDG